MQSPSYTKRESTDMRSHRPLISRLEIQNFKSIHSAELDFSGLTVLVGENSAGKSSVLQSIFLMAQNLHGHSQQGEINLNGTELTLGSFEEVLHHGSEESVIKIGLYIPQLESDLSIPIRTDKSAKPDLKPEDSGYAPVDAWILELENSNQNMGLAVIKRVTILDTFGTENLDEYRSEKIDLYPSRNSELVSSMINESLKYGFVGRDSELARIKNKHGAEPEIKFKGYEGWNHDEYEYPHDNQGLEWGWNEPFALVDQGLPVELYHIDSKFSAIFRKWFADLMENSGGNWNDLDQRPVSVKTFLDDGVDWNDLNLDLIADKLNRNFQEYIDAFDSVGGMHEFMTRKFGFSSKNLDLLKENFFEIHRELADIRKIDLGEVGDRSNNPGIIDSAWRPDYALAIRDRLENAVHYLGPLRMGPVSFFRGGQIGDVATLGVSGEYTVATLTSRYHQKVICPILDGDPIEITLGEAVDYWASAFNLAGSVSTSDIGHGNLGLELVDSQTGSERDLGSLGVGVSQLLPVIVLCLLAQPGELVMVEQPELHLHPAPQQILGDFLIELTKTGRQLIVETHSEYLVNRLRLRVVQDQTDDIKDLVDIYYGSRASGVTKFSSLSINEFGSFDRWPDGFFDQSITESEEILRSAALKRISSS